MNKNEIVVVKKDLIVKDLSDEMKKIEDRHGLSSNQIQIIEERLKPENRWLTIEDFAKVIKHNAEYIRRQFRHPNVAECYRELRRLEVITNNYMVDIDELVVEHIRKVMLSTDEERKDKIASKIFPDRRKVEISISENKAEQWKKWL